MACKLTFAGLRFDTVEEMTEHIKLMLDSKYSLFDEDTGELLYYTESDLEQFIESDDFKEYIKAEEIVNKNYTSSVQSANEYLESIQPNIPGEPSSKKVNDTTDKSTLDEDRLDRVKRFTEKMLNKYTYKIDRTRFNESEISQFRNSVKTFFAQTLINMDVDEISETKALTEATRDTFLKQLKIAEYNIDIYIDEFGSTIDESELKKVKQLKSALSSYAEDKIRVHKTIKEGIDSAIVDLGYRKQNVMSENELEENQETDDQNAWQDINYNIQKNIKDGATAKLRARFLTLYKYVYDNGEVKVDTNIIGAPISVDNAFTEVVAILSENVYDSFSDKLKHLKDLVSVYDMNPVANIERLYLKDLVAQLEGTLIKGNYNFREIMQFNTVTNKSENYMKGVSINRTTKKLTITDFVFNTVFKKTLVKLNSLIDNFRKTDFADEFTSNVADRETSLPSTNLTGNKKRNIENLNSTYDKLITKTAEDFKEAPLPELLELLSSIHNINTVVRRGLESEIKNNKIQRNSYSTLIANLFDMDKNDIEKYFNTDEGGQYTSNFYQAVDAYINRFNPIKDSIRDAMIDKLEYTLSTLELPITPLMRVNLLEALMNGDTVHKVDYYGNNLATEIPLSQALNDLIKDLKNALNDKDKSLTPLARPFLKWLAESNSAKSFSSVQQIGSKQVSTLVDPIYLERQFKKILTDKLTRKEIDEDIYSTSNFTLGVLDNPDNKNNIDWLSAIYKKFNRAGLKPTWLSDIDEVDKPELFGLWDLGLYLASIDFAYKSKNGGASYENIKVVIDGVEKVIKVRGALFSMPTHSDKDAEFSTLGLDFDAYDAETGEFKEDYLKMFIDANIVPELRRLSKANKLDNVKGRDASIVYMLRQLNELDENGVDLRKLFKTFSLPDDFKSIFDPEFENMNKLSDVRYFQTRVMSLLRNQIESEMDNNIQKLVDTGLIEKVGDFYVLSKTLAGVQDFQSLLIEKEELLKQNEEFVQQQEKRDKIIENLNDYLDTIAIALNDDNILVNGDLNIYTLSSLVKQDKRDDFIKNYEANVGNKSISGQLRLAFEMLGLKLDYRDVNNLRELLQSEQGSVPLTKELLKEETIEFSSIKKQLEKIAFGLDLNEIGIVSTKSLYDNWDELVDEYELDLESIVVDRTIKNSKGFKRLKDSLTNENGFKNYDKGEATEYTLDEFELGLTLKDMPAYTRIISSGKVINTGMFNRLMANKSFSYSHHIAQTTQLLYGDMAHYYSQAYKNDGVDRNSADYDLQADIDETYTNAGKRYAMFVSPAVMSTSVQPTKIKYISIKEPIRHSHVYTDDNTYGVDAHKKIKVADAQTYMTKKSYLQFLMIEGVIDEAEASDVEKYWEGKMTEEELDAKYPNRNLSENASIISVKPRLVGHRMEQIEGSRFKIKVPVYIKMSTIVLTEQFVGKNKENGLRKLYDTMSILESRENPDGTSLKNWTAVHAAPGTAIKVGNTKTSFDLDNAVYDENGEINVHESMILDLNMSMFGRQNRTDAHINNKLKSSGQQFDIATNELSYDDPKVKILGDTDTANLLEALNEVLENKRMNSLRAIYSLFSDINNRDAIDKLIGNDTATMKESSENLVKTINDETLANIIKSAIIAQNKTEAIKANPLILEGLATDQGIFKYDLASSEYLQFYLDILRTAIEKKSIKRKRSGFTVPLISDAYIDLRDSKKGDNGIILMSEYKPTETGTLRPQEPTNNAENNYAEIILPWDFTAYDSKGKEITLNMDDYLVYYDKNGEELKDITAKQIKNKQYASVAVDETKLPQDILRSLVYRTPNQDYSMSASVKIVGFLPKSMKNSVIAPAEFVALMGSDFDIDKLFGYKMNLFINKKGKVKAIDKSFKGTEFDDMYWDNRENNILMTIANQPKILKNHSIKALEGEKTFYQPTLAMEGTVLSENAEMSFIDRINSILNADKVDYENQSFLSQSFQQTKRDNAIASKTGVGVFAKFARVYSQINIIVPEIFTSKSKDAVQKSKIEFGPMSFTHFGDGRPAVFFVTDKETGEKVSSTTNIQEKDFDTVKTNNSALISVNVDNEKLQMIHKLNLNQDTYDTITSLMALGFRAKTAIAFSLFNKSHVNEDLLISVYNKGKAKSDQITKNKIAFTGADIKIVYQGMEETVLIDRTLEMLEKFSNFSDASRISDEDVESYFAIKAFISKTNSAFKTTIKPYGWAVNSDSKGIVRDITKFYNSMKTILPVGKMSKIWDQMQKHQTKYTNATIYSIFNELLNKVFDSSSEVGDVMSILGNANITIPGLFDVSNIIRAKKMSKLKPNFKSLKNRLDTLKRSNDPKIIELLQNNLFLSRLDVRKTYISFKRDNINQPVDIQNDLEALNDLGTIGGIDMSLLYQDLVYYGATTTQLTYGNTYTHLIHPRHLNTSNIDAKFSVADLYDIAAFVAFKNIELVHTDNSDNPSMTISKSFNKGTNSHVLTVVMPDGELKKYTKNSFEGMLKLSSDEYVWKNFSPMDLDDVQKIPSSKEQVMISYEETAERILSNKRDNVLKNFLKMIKPAGMFFTTQGSTDSSYDWDTNHMKLGAKMKNTDRLRHTFIHESVHMGISKVVDFFDRGALGKLFKGKNEQNKYIAEEVGTILENIQNYRYSVLDGMYEKVGTPDDVSSNKKGLNAIHVLTGIAVSLVQTDFRNLRHMIDKTMVDKVFAHVSKSERKDILKSAQKNELTNNEQVLLSVAILEKAFREGSVVVEPDTFISIGGVKTQMYSDSRTIDSFKTLFNESMSIIENNYAGYAQTLDNASNSDNVDVAFKKVEYAIQQSIYGTLNNNEFTAQSFRYGTGNKHGSYSAYAAAVDVSYDAIADNTDKQYEGVMAKVFKLLKDLLNAILGKDAGNKLWKDVNYLMLLNNASTFVNSNNANKSVSSVDIQYTKDAEDLMKICK